MIKMQRGLQPDQWSVKGFFVLGFLEIAPNFYLTKFTQAKSGRGIEQWAIFEAKDDRTSTRLSDHTDYFKPLITLRRNRSRWSGKIMSVSAFHDMTPYNYTYNRNLPSTRILLTADYPDEDKYLPVAFDTMVSFANLLGLPVRSAHYAGEYKELFDAEVSRN